MIDLNSQLDVKYSDGVTYTDYTSKAASFAKDTFTEDYFGGIEYFYIGYKKPISSIFMNHNTSYSVDGTLSGQYWNGTAWTAIDGLSDDTLGFKRIGFIRWELSQANQSSNTVNGVTKFWYRFQSTQDRAAMIVAGINLVLADDYELSLEQPYINDVSFKSDQRSHILIHAAVRNEILQKFTNKDYVKLDSSGRYVDINVWDLHQILEVKQAAVFLALSKIYNNMSDQAADGWAEKSAKYAEKYEQMINIARLSLDLNDDGIEQSVEQKACTTMRYMSR